MRILKYGQLAVRKWVRGREAHGLIPQWRPDKDPQQAMTDCGEHGGVVAFYRWAIFQRGQ